MVKSLLLLIIIVLSLNSARAQWQSYGPPDNVIVSCLAISGPNIFAGTYFAGVYLSTDEGVNWAPVDTGLTTNYIYALAISGSNLFAATDGGVFLSTDNGSHWKTWNNLLTGIRVNSLAISGAEIFAGTVDYGVYISTDSAATWTAMNTGLPNTVYVNSVATSGADILASTNSSGVFLSSDNGSHWTVDGLTGLDVLTLAVNDTGIFAGIFNGTYGAYLSTDTGSQWTALDSAPLSITSFAINGSNIFAGTWSSGVYWSDNNGANWISLGLTDYIITSLAISDSFLFAGVYDSVWRISLGNFGCNLASPFITSGNNIFCSGDSTQICAPGGYTSYRWNTLQTDSCLSAKQAGNYYVTVTDNNGCTAESNYISVSVYPVPSVSIIVQGDTLSSFGAVSYRWYLNGSPTGIDTGAVFIAKQAGSYTLLVTDTNGCTATSNAVAITGISELTNGNLSLYPNPANNSFVIECATGEQELQLFDITGKLLLSQIIQNGKTTIDASGLAAGVYLVSLKSAGITNTEKVVIAR